MLSPNGVILLMAKEATTMMKVVIKEKNAIFILGLIKENIL